MKLAYQKKPQHESLHVLLVWFVFTCILAVMARVTPLTDEQIANCRAMNLLRLALKISRTDFAQMIGLSTENLAGKEAARSPFKPEEISNAASLVAKHLSNGAQALAAVTVRNG